MLVKQRILNRRRAAFTLTEMLVVIAIIGVLSSLAAWGVIAVIGNRQAGNTQATMKVLGKLMQSRWSAVIADAKKEPPSAAATALAMGPPPGNLDPSGKRAQVIMIKARLMEAFPITYTEVLAPPFLGTYITQPKPYWARYQSTLTGMTTGSAGESSACLLMALKALQAENVGMDDQLKPFIAPTDSDGVNPVVNTIPTLMDAWTKPLSFSRFPTSANVQTKNPATANARGVKFADPIDPDGLLMSPTWYNSPAFPNTAVYPAAWRGQTAVAIYQAAFHTIARPAPNQASANYTIPVIVSNGRDGKLGLNITDLSIPPAGVAIERDNIYSYDLRLD